MKLIEGMKGRGGREGGIGLRNLKEAICMAEERDPLFSHKNSTCGL